MATGRRKQLPDNILRRITKVFITNLPERCSGKDLAEHIRSFGDIYDIYIARKRDKFGKRFGFVSFLDVKESRDLIMKISNTRIGDCWLTANIARFTLEEGEIRPEPKASFKQYSCSSNIHNVKERPTFGNGSRSFLDAVTGRREERSIVIDNDVHAFKGLHGKAIVARMLDLDALQSIHLILNDICPGSGKVQYLGGLSVFISFEDEKTVASVITKAKEVVGRFSCIDIWEGQALGLERLAWLKLHGLPLHLIDKKVIDAVGNSFGKILHRASRSDEDDDLSYDSIGVLVGDEKRIAESVKLIWNGKKFNIWVAEDNGQWVPEFFKPTQSFQQEDVNSDDVLEGVVAGNEKSGEHSQSTEGEGQILETPMFVENVTEVVNEGIDGCEYMEGFIPGNLFNFDNNLQAEVEGVDHGNVNVLNKRKKKNGLNDMGRPNTSYSSSLEKDKLKKKPKGDGDIFGLDQLLGLNSERVAGPVSTHQETISFDLNTPPARGRCNIEQSELDPETVIKENEDVLRKEIEATVSLGRKLGVHLGEAHKLIHDSIVQEGLQGGKK